MTTSYLQNMSPSQVLTQEETQEEVWSGQKPYVAHLKMLNCKGFVWIPNKNRTKVGDKPWIGIFVGYASGSKKQIIFNLGTWRAETSMLK